MDRQTSNWRTFVRLLGFLRPYRGAVGVSAVLAGASAGAAATIALLTGDVVDSAFETGDRDRLWLVIGLILGIGAGKGLLMIGRRLISGRVALAIELDLRNALYARLLRLSFGFYDRSQTGQLMSRATVDLQAVRFFLGYGLIFLFQHLVTIVGVTAVLFIVDWRLALVTLAIIPLLVAIAYRFSEVSHPVLRDVQQKMADVATVAEESIVGVNVVKSFAREPELEARFARRTEEVFGRSLAAARQRALYVPLMSFLPLVGQAAVMLVGGHFVVGGSMSLGDFVAFNVLLQMLVMPLRMLGMWIGQTQRATASGERVFEVLDEVEEVAELAEATPLPAGPGAIRFEGVTFAYGQATPVLEGVELEIAPGSTVALVGHTGSGKTTLAALIPRYYDPEAGRVLLDGVDVRALTLTSLRGAVGVVAQDPFLFSATVRENIAFGSPDATDEAVERAARIAQAHEFVQRLPEGYDTVIGERGITLSGGQRQRLAIARALCTDPRVLVLDDSTASVDASTESRIRAGLAEAMEGRTTVVIAHRLSTIALADEIVVLDGGRVAARGTHVDLIETSPIYREIVEHGLLERQVVDDLLADGDGRDVSEAAA
ncbi:MAG: ABC transporter ATP-binding protein [Actinobacteria bacterium]|nr:ABC transporter ATP-binding protein [Actinomycetota bacterium]